ncbi:MAG: pantoate kinase [Candidatus Thorarchaeota archaeon]
MSERVKKIVVKIPHRISGFFEIVDKVNGARIKEPERIGSRGAGFCVDAVGKTEVLIQNLKALDESGTEIYINGKLLNQKAETTYYIIKYINNYLKKPYRIRIRHFFDLPVGCGYGASGSGALGTIFGLDYLLNLKLSLREKGRIAHIAEVVNKTGLGTVCGQINGGMGILREPGFPCVYERIKVPRGLKIICGSFGIIHTKSILNDPILSLKIKEAGKRALAELIREPNIKSFIKSSIEFVKNTKILEILQLPELDDLIKTLNKLDIIGASMNQLGRSVYTICRKENEKEVLNVFESYKPEITVYNTTIQKSRSIILEKRSNV